MSAPWTDDALVEFVLGTLSDEDASAIRGARHEDVSLAARITEIETLVHGVVAGTTARPPSVPVERLWERLDGVCRFEPLVPTVAALLGIDESSARAELDALDEPDGWQDGVLPGTTMKTVATDEPDTGILWLKMPPGMAFPEHEHLGDETVLVVQGRYLDDEGRLHPPGSVLREGTDTAHGFHIAADGPEFICLAIVHRGVRVGGNDIGREQLYGA